MKSAGNQSNVTIRRKKGFTVIQNYILDDLTVSEKALGLYSRIQRWVGFEGNTFDGEPFVLTKAFVKSRTTMGTKAFDSAWNELKERGYLKMYFTPPANWEAELLEEPQPDTPHTYYLNANGEVKSTNVDRAAKKAAGSTEKEPEPAPEQDSMYYPPFGSNTKDSNTKDSNTNGGNYINTNNKTNHNTINKDSYPIISGDSKFNSVSKEEYEKMRYDVMDQINYEFLCEYFRDIDVDAWVDLIMDIKITNEETLTGSKIPAHLVKERLSGLNQYIMHYIISEFMKNEKPVQNIRNYMIKCLYNGPATYAPKKTNDLKSRYAYFTE